MTPADIRDLADRQDHMSAVAPVLRAMADLLEAMEQDIGDLVSSDRILRALTRIEELRP